MLGSRPSSLVAGLLSALLLASAGNSAAIEPVSGACTHAPTRACVLDHAYVLALTIEPPWDRYVQLRAVAAAQDKAGLTAAATSRAAAVALLGEARAQARKAAVTPMAGIGRLRQIAAAQLELGLTKEAAQTLSEAHQSAQGFFWTSTAIRGVAEAEMKAGLTAEAQQSFARALEIAQSLKDTWLRVNEARLVAESELKTSAPGADVALAQALRATQDIKDARIHATAIAAVAETQAASGAREEAAKTFALAVQTALSANPLSMRNEALLAVADKQATAGMAAAETLEQALKAARAIDYAEQRFSTLMRTAEAYAKLGQVTTAGPVFIEARDAAKATKRANALLGVADAQVKVGLVTDAVETLQQAAASTNPSEGPFHNPSGGMAAQQNRDWHARWHADILCRISQSHARDGRRDEAMAALGAALAKARAISAPGWRANALWLVAQTRSATGLADANATMKEATAALDEAFQQARGGHEFARSYALDGIAGLLINIARAQAKAGHADDAASNLAFALRVTRSMNYPTSRNPSYQSIATAYAVMGKATDALDVVSSISTQATAIKTLASIAEALRD